MKNQKQSSQTNGTRKLSILFGAILIAGAFNAQASSLVDVEKSRESNLKDLVLEQYLKDTADMCSDGVLAFQEELKSV